MASFSDASLPFPEGLKRSGHSDDQVWMDSALYLLDLVSKTLGRKDLDGVEVLDVGCGTKTTKALIDHGLPIGRYVGVDVSRDVIDWLDTHVSDPRFEFHHLAARNEMYNRKETRTLSSYERLPIGDRRFDLICLFSVFTHLAPDDYTAMLRLLRQHVKPDGVLLYSLFVMETPQGAMNTALEASLNSDDPERARRAKRAIELALAKGGSPEPEPEPVSVPRFIDEIPDKPLDRARYSKDYALELIEGTGWEVTALRPPEPPYIQHYMICRPVPSGPR